MAHEAENSQTLNMNRSLRVAIETSAMPWEESPSAGVSRKKLEREEAEWEERDAEL